VAIEGIEAIDDMFASDERSERLRVRRNGNGSESRGMSTA